MHAPLHLRLTSVYNVPFYVAYVPIKGRLYELDGLREGPLDHGAIPSGQDWISTVKPIIEARISKYQAGEIHFNLMAVIQDKLVNYNYLGTDIGYSKLGFWKCHGEMGLRQVEQSFFHFCNILGLFDDFSK